MEGHWTDRAPRSLIDPEGPRGEPITTPTDRRWLWHLENNLTVLASWDSELGRIASDLKQYLNETCEHHWQHCDADDYIPEHRQCLWCQDIEWLGEYGPDVPCACTPEHQHSSPWGCVECRCRHWPMEIANGEVSR